MGALGHDAQFAVFGGGAAADAFAQGTGHHAEFADFLRRRPLGQQVRRQIAIDGQLLDGVVGDEVRPAVAEIGETKLMALQPADGQRRAHQIFAGFEIVPAIVRQRPFEQALRAGACGRGNNVRKGLVRAAVGEGVFDDDGRHHAGQAAGADIAGGNAVGDERKGALPVLLDEDRILVAALQLCLGSAGARVPADLPLQRKPVKARRWRARSMLAASASARLPRRFVPCLSESRDNPRITTGMIPSGKPGANTRRNGSA